MIFLDTVKKKWRIYKSIGFEIFIVLSVVFFRWWLGKNQILISNGGSVYDDQLFVNYANSMLHGHWLGNYNEFTLVKDIFYSLWIAIMYCLQIPLFWSQQFFYIFASTIMYVAIRLRYKGVFPFVIYCIILFNPIFYQVSERVIRYHIYTSLSLVLVSVLLINDYVRSIKSSYYAMCVFIIGIVSGVYYITREEFIWFVPVLVCSLVYPVIQDQHAKTKLRNNTRYCSLLVKSIVPFVCGMVLVLASVVGMNYRMYGVVVINELKQSPFISVYGDLLRINHKNQLRYIIIPNEVIDIASRVSPNFSKLQTVIKGPDVQWARTQTEEYVGLGTNEIGSNEFVFVLRQAASQLGYFSDAKTSFHFFSTIHHDLSLACATGAISCYPVNLRVFLPIKAGDISFITESFFHSISTLLYYDEIDTHIFPSVGIDEDVSYIQSMTRSARMSDRSSATTWVDYASGTYASDIPQTHIIQMMLAIYTKITVWIFIIGLMSYVVLAVKAVLSHKINFLFVFLTSLFISMFLLILLVSYLAAIQSPLPKLTYMAPVSPLLSLFSCLSIYEVLRIKRKK